MKRKQGLHLLGSLIDCDEQIMCDKVALTNFLMNFPSKIGMTIVDVEGNPYFHRTHEIYGWTCGITLYESNIVIHTWPEYLSIDFDIFSCKVFDSEFALQQIKYFFSGIPVGCLLLERGFYGAKVIDFIGEKQ